MFTQNGLWIAKGENPVYLLPSMANRHGLIAGATGTGKTVTLKVMAESFSDMGVPVFLADIKGDLAGLAAPGSISPKLQDRLNMLGLDSLAFKSYPVRFWDLFGEAGHPVRTTISEMGALLLSRILGLNETQSGVLNIIFRIADDRGLLLLDLKDLRSMIQYVGDRAKEFTLDYGNISSQSIGAILRSLIALEDQGGAFFFGEPAIDIFDWMQTAPDGRGVINILDSVKLFQTPILYATFMLWLLSELFESLPEMGDMDKPRMVFFFDEAHLLFEDAPKILLQKIEQVVRLIRSKGVGVYFITQNPNDLPQDVLAQLGNRVQHALRAYTPAELKRVKAAADSFRPNPKFDTQTAINELATGEALVSFLDPEGRPSIVERCFILPPQSLLGTLDSSTRSQIIASSPKRGKYEQVIDRESAYELLQAKVKQEQDALLKQQDQQARLRQWEREEKQRSSKSTGSKSRKQTSIVQKATNSVVSSMGREIGRSLARGLLGSFKKF